jgi:MSHA biogenesis protein MshJ
MIRARWRQLADRLDSLSLRERALVFAAALAVLFGLWFNFFAVPMERQGEAMDRRAEALQAQLEQLNQRSRLVAEQLARDPDRALEQEKARLQGRLTSVDEALRERTGAYVGPDQMARLLQQLLADRRGLNLLRAENVAPERVTLEGEADEAMIPIYRHGVVLEFEGRFGEIVDYLNAVQDLPWRFLWKRLEYEVTDFPKARVRLTLETLSAQEGWIGA